MENLDRLFNPHSVAVVGDKQQTGYMWLRNLSIFEGRVYSVQTDEKELPGIEALGVKNYFNLLDIPEEVDYVIVALPRAVTHKIGGTKLPLPRKGGRCFKEGGGIL